MLTRRNLLMVSCAAAPLSLLPEGRRVLIPSRIATDFEQEFAQLLLWQKRVVQHALSGNHNVVVRAPFRSGKTHVVNFLSKYYSQILQEQGTSVSEDIQNSAIRIQQKEAAAFEIRSVSLEEVLA